MAIPLKKVIKDNYLITSMRENVKRIYFQYLISDERLLKKKFGERLNKDLNLDTPITYNEKLQWLKLNWKDPRATKCADKYEVREIVANSIGSKYLNEIYGVYENVDEINIDLLPNEFVLKGTHGSGFNIICKDKTKHNWDKEFKKMKRWLKKNYYWQNREWVYKDIKPRIIAERYIEEIGNGELKDYRFFCFNGEPKFISVDFNITNKTKTKRNLYNLDWEFLEYEISYPRELQVEVEKPKKLNEMIELSKVLSQGFPHSRIDFYYTEKDIIFGEITFFHQSGMAKINPPEFDELMGKWINII